MSKIQYKVGNKLFNKIEDAQKYVAELNSPKRGTQKVIGNLIVFTKPTGNTSPAGVDEYLRKDIFPITNPNSESLLDSYVDKHKKPEIFEQIVEIVLSSKLPIYTPVKEVENLKKTFMTYYAGAGVDLDGDNFVTQETFVHRPFSLKSLSYSLNDSIEIVEGILIPILE